MLFHTTEFLGFLAVVFGLYWLLAKKLRWQNTLILAASYFFYGCWDWRFLLLIALSSITDYLVALNMERGPRKWLLALSLVVNLGMLGVFKYFDFFVGSLSDLLSTLGFSPNLTLLGLITPVGISFYTFQTLSYTIDVYNRKIEPLRDPIAFFSYVSFFPQLVAGPIERAQNLLPQFTRNRQFDYAFAVSGCRLFLWGLAKKVFVADPAGRLCDHGFANYTEEPGWRLYFYVIAFAFQIYGDFSGYTDMARGVARMFGFDLMQNFRTPYFATSIADFWRRWHISLTTWFRDYVFIPLGGSRGPKRTTLINVIIVFLVSGFWHGANWTFIAWGAINALLFIPSIFLPGKKRDPESETGLIPRFSDLVRILVTFNLVCVTWIFFRAPNLGTAFDYLKSMIFNSLAAPGGIVVAIRHFAKEPAFWSIATLLVLEWIGTRTRFKIDLIPTPIRWAIYLVVFLSAVLITHFGSKEKFIYFQF
ncbi:MAG: MBOAT family protein [Verrucomicrobiota bacterium]